MSLITIPAKEVDQYAAMPCTVLIDMRNEQEYRQGHIPGAVNIPYEIFADNKLCLLRKNTIILYCERGNLSLQEARVLDREGYCAITVYGGIHAYRGKLSID